jgi:acetyl esterase/lipase
LVRIRPSKCCGPRLDGTMPGSAVQIGAAQRSATGLETKTMRQAISAIRQIGFSALFASVLTAWAFASPLAGAETPAAPERISLWTGQTAPSKAAITVHHPTESNGAAVVICPGGGYGGLVSGPEGHGIARWLNEHGIVGIVLEYELPRGRPMVPLGDVQLALRMVRTNAESWKIDEKRIGVMGFSAGGHLASTAGTHFDAGDPKATDPIDRVSCRPDFMVLVYPVITMGEKTHRGSKQSLLGKNPSVASIALFSNETQVTNNTPPTFLAHAKDDKAVVPDNSRLFHTALKAHNVPSEYLELASGGHGLNGYRGPMWDAWQTGSLRWLASQGMIPEASARIEK